MVADLLAVAPFALFDPRSDPVSLVRLPRVVDASPGRHSGPVVTGDSRTPDADGREVEPE